MLTLHPPPHIRRAALWPTAVVVMCACVGTVIDHRPNPCNDTSSDGPQYACWLRTHPQ